MSNGTSLDQLNDIAQPAAVSWWPLATGWYVLATLAVIVLLLGAWKYWQSVRRNRYRREALRELDDIRQSPDSAALQQLPILLKRVALNVWPREDVASLSGSEWHAFLDRTAETSLFGSGAGKFLDQLSYGTGVGPHPGESDCETVLQAADFWLRRHHDKPVKG